MGLLDKYTDFCLLSWSILQNPPPHTDIFIHTPHKVQFKIILPSTTKNAQNTINDVVLVVCIDLSGKEPHRQVSVGIVVTSGS